MKKIILTLVLGLSVITMAGCASVSGNPDLAKIKITKNLNLLGLTKTQIIKKYGEPENIINIHSKLANTKAKSEFIYFYKSVKTKLASYIPVVNMIFGGTTVKKRELDIYFNKKNKVVDYSISR